MAALIPFNARIFLIRVRCERFNPLMVPMYFPWSFKALR